MIRDEDCLHHQSGARTRTNRVCPVRSQTLRRRVRSFLHVCLRRSLSHSTRRCFIAWKSAPRISPRANARHVSPASTGSEPSERAKRFFFATSFRDSPPSSATSREPRWRFSTATLAGRKPPAPRPPEPTGRTTRYSIDVAARRSDRHRRSDHQKTVPADAGRRIFERAADPSPPRVLISVATSASFVTSAEGSERDVAVSNSAFAAATIVSSATRDASGPGAGRGGNAPRRETAPPREIATLATSVLGQRVVFAFCLFEQRFRRRPRRLRPRTRPRRARRGLRP